MRWTVFLYLAIFCVAVLLVIWMMQGFLLNLIYYNIAVRRLDRAAGELSEVACSPDDYEAAQALAVGYQMSLAVFEWEEGELGARFLQVNGDGGSVLPRLTNGELHALCAEAAESGGGVERSYIHRYVFRLPDGSVEPGGENEQLFESRRLIVVRLTENSEGNPIAIFLDCALLPVGTAASTLLVEIILLSGILILAALILAYFLSRRIVQPITRMNRSAQALAAGHYDVHFEGGSYREIEQLSETLNYAASELGKVENLQRELIANISHDLRTPLTMIIGYGEIMRDIAGENTPQNVQVIIDEAKRLSDLVNDLLQLSRCQAGVEKLQIEKFDMGETVRQTLDRYRQLLASRGFVFEEKVEAGLTVRADRQKILQVLYNLINNAVNYSGDSRLIEVGCYRTEAGAVRLEVIDHGEGIPQEKLPDIWQRYYKADAQHKRSVVGSGLGLSIVRGILELHRARYGVDSRVGKGSRFWFELPPEDGEMLPSTDEKR